jgi:hypothetical protein
MVAPKDGRSPRRRGLLSPTHAAHPTPSALRASVAAATMPTVKGLAGPLPRMQSLAGSLAMTAVGAGSLPALGRGRSASAVRRRRAGRTDSGGRAPNGACLEAQHRPDSTLLRRWPRCRAIQRRFALRVG